MITSDGKLVVYCPRRQKYMTFNLAGERDPETVESWKKIGEAMKELDVEGEILKMMRDEARTMEQPG